MFSMFKGVVHFELMSWQDECRIMICFWRGWIERVIQWLKKQSHLLGRDKELEVGELSKPIACMLGGGKAPRLSEVHCDRDSVCVKTDT